MGFGIASVIFRYACFVFLRRGRFKMFVVGRNQLELALAIFRFAGRITLAHDDLPLWLEAFIL